MAAEKVLGGSASGGASNERGGAAVVASEEVNGNSNMKVTTSGGGAGSAYRWHNGDAVPLKRRRVGLSNGVSVSDAGVGDSSDDDDEDQQEEEEERAEEEDEVGEDVEEVAAEEYSDYYELNGAGNGLGPHTVEEEEAEDDVEEEPDELEEAEDEEEDDDDQHLLTASMEHQHHHRGGIGSNRGRDSRHGFDEHDDLGTEDEGFDEGEHHVVHDSPKPFARPRGVIHRERERTIDISNSPEQVGGLDETEESDEVSPYSPPPPAPPQPPVMSRGIIDRGQSSAASAVIEGHHQQRHPQHKREPMPKVRVFEKPARGIMDTAKRKVATLAPAPASAPSVVAIPPPRNSNVVEVKPKKERAPAASRKKTNAGDGATTTGASRERTRFTADSKARADNKTRVTLERAREILASVKAAMMKNPKHFTVRHAETHAAVENSSSSDEDRRRRPMQHHPPAASRAAVHQQQQLAVKTEDKVVKKRSRAAGLKAEKEPTPRRRKQPKAEIDYHHVTEDKLSLNRSRPQQQEDAYDHHAAYKVGHFSTSGAEQGSREGREMTMEDHRSNGYSRDDSMYEQQQITVVEKKVRKRRKAKEGEDGASGTGLCPGSVIRDENWAPPASPFGLIQESLYKDPWKVLLSCMLLNKTAGRQFLVQMHKVIWDLFSLCPDAETAIKMDTAKIAEKVYSLGLQNKRAKMIQRFSSEYLRGDWTNVTQLHGIGKYAADAYAIFCQGLWREVEPDDVMLIKYWKWLWETNGEGTGFVSEIS